MAPKNQKLTKADPDGSRRRAKKAGKPKREKGSWPIRRAPTPELKAALADKQADADEEIEELEEEIAASAEEHKQLKNKKQKEIEEVRKRLKKLRQEVRHGETATVECWRHKEGDPPEWVYTDHKREELWREPAADGTQQRLVGKETAPKPADGWVYDMATAEGRCRRYELIAWLLSLPDPPERPSQTSWPACELSWHPRVRWCQERLLGPGEDETDEVRQPGDEQAPVKLSWGKIPRQLIWHTKGSRVHQYRIDLQQSPGDLIITAGAPNKPSEHMELHRWYLAGPDPLTAEVKRAKKWCQQHRDSRLQWPGDPESGVLLDSTGRYQLSAIRIGEGPRAGELECWRAEAIGGQDEDNTDLGEHDELTAAQAACQHHADAGRAGQ
jgi:hypothetical protein